MTETSELLCQCLKEFAESDVVDELVVDEMTRTLAERGVDISVEDAELVRLAVAVTLAQLLESLVLTFQFDR